MMKHIKALLFDFDETIAFRNGMWTATICELLRESGYDHITRSMIEPLTHFGFPWQDYEIPHAVYFKGMSWWGYFERKITGMLGELGVPQGEAGRISRAFKDRYLDLRYWHLYDDVFPVLERAAGEYACYIVSNHIPEMNQILQGLKIDHFFEQVFNSALIGYEKPHTGIFRKVITDLQLSPHSLVMIGNNYIADITGARSNGIHAILVREPNTFHYKYHCPDLSGIFDRLVQIEAVTERRADEKGIC